jgi:hypothetical protein
VEGEHSRKEPFEQLVNSYRNIYIQYEHATTENASDNINFLFPAFLVFEERYKYKIKLRLILLQYLPALKRNNHILVLLYPGILKYTEGRKVVMSIQSQWGGYACQYFLFPGPGGYRAYIKYLLRDE